MCEGRRLGRNKVSCVKEGWEGIKCNVLREEGGRVLSVMCERRFGRNKV